MPIVVHRVSIQKSQNNHYNSEIKIKIINIVQLLLENLKKYLSLCMNILVLNFMYIFKLIISLTS